MTRRNDKRLEALKSTPDEPAPATASATSVAADAAASEGSAAASTTASVAASTTASAAASTTASAAATSLQPRSLPQWDDLPDFGLYMDQVLSLMDRYLNLPANTDEKGLTASMVNNYVKTGVIPAPEKKKYSRIHLASLVVVCTLKPVLPLAVIQKIISDVLGEDAPQRSYNAFCEQFNAAEKRASGNGETQGVQVGASDEGSADTRAAIVSAALDAQAQRNRALALFRSSFPA